MSQYFLGEVPFEAGAETIEAVDALRGAVGRRRPRRADAAHDGQRRPRMRLPRWGDEEDGGHEDVMQHSII